jgi:exodeoxyribonuclease VIII
MKCLAAYYVEPKRLSPKEEPWKSWSAILRNQPGPGRKSIAIFNLIRIAPENIHITPVAHLEFVNKR